MKAFRHSVRSQIGFLTVTRRALWEWATKESVAVSGSRPAFDMYDVTGFL